MKHFTRKLTGTLLALTLSASMAVPSLAEITYDKSITAYATPGSNSTYGISINNLTSKQSVSKSSVKTSNSKVAKLYSVFNSKNSGTYKTDFFDKSMSPYNHKSNDSSARIEFQGLKQGSATISFKIGSKTYKSKVRILKYVNPIKSLTITGINNGKNLAGKFAKSNNAAGTLKKAVSNGAITVTPKSGWGIESVTFVDYTKHVSRSISADSHFDSKKEQYITQPLSSAKISGLSLKKKTDGNIYVTMKNLSNDAEIYLTFELK